MTQRDLTAEEKDILSKALLRSSRRVASAYTDDEIAAIKASARAEGMREGLEQALHAVSTLPAYSPELERAHKAIRAILSAIGEKP